MQTAHRILYWFLEHWPDVVLAIGLAIVVDLLRLRSRTSEAWRWTKDKLAEGSVADITRRIAQQEKYRNSLQSYLASDKAFYMAMLRSLVGILLFMCIAGAIVLLDRLGVMIFPVGAFAALGALIMAITAGVYTMQLGTFDASKLSELITKVDAEIAELKEARSRLQKARNII
jgi:hypothetical protein